MITPNYSLTSTERVLPRLALDFTTAITDARVVTVRANNTATRFNANGALEIVNADLARYDFDPVTLVCKGQLIEETRTNLFLNSLIDGTVLTTQVVVLTATAYTLSFYGTGNVVISGGHSATVTGSGAFPARKTYTFTPTAGSSTFTVSGTVSYAQLEAGAFATSYIPTTTTSLTRNGDFVSMTGTNFSSWYNAAEGTLAIQAIGRVGTGGNYYYALSDGTLNNAIYGFAGSNNGPVRPLYAYVSNSEQATLNSTVNCVGTYTLVAAYKQNNFIASVSGNAPTTDALGTIPTVNRLAIGCAISNVGQLNGHIAKVSYWPMLLTSAEVQAFSK